MSQYMDLLVTESDDAELIERGDKWTIGWIKERLNECMKERVRKRRINE